jgi:hypothetical protein
MQNLSFHVNAVPDMDTSFHINVNPDPAPHQSDANLRPLIYRASTAPFRAAPPASTVSGHAPPKLHFEPLQLLNFDFNADLDPAFHSVCVTAGKSCGYFGADV